MLRRKTAIYALLSLYDIATHVPENSGNKGMRAGDISERHALPRAYAAKILSQLAGAGILHSDRGPRGGFRLQRPASDISLYEVFQAVGAIETFDQDDNDLGDLPIPVRSAIRGVTDHAAGGFKNYLERITLQDVVSRQPVDVHVPT
ncbi:MAG: Rrf2 family transcriptional regulator [Phycisphaerales bacterium]|nr:Rrf2 family transcriptional regulator [Phycisphaerales bacterium]MCB9855441.1 Rrf2 family transcriptional regulator [Phycisphaerales bacterium]